MIIELRFTIKTISLYEELILALKTPFTTIIAFAVSVDQDQAAQDMYPDLGSTLSALLQYCRQTQP